MLRPLVVPAPPENDLMALDFKKTVPPAVYLNELTPNTLQWMENCLNFKLFFLPSVLEMWLKFDLNLDGNPTIKMNDDVKLPD